MGAKVERAANEIRRVKACVTNLISIKSAVA
jgi:hypothetical protein